LLIVDDLRVSYGPLEVLKGISFTVGEAEIVTILGSNGAGKTTTLRAISGFPCQKRGSIRFAGQDIDALPPHRVVAAGLCLVPEGRQLFTDQTVQENLRLGAFRRLRAGEVGAVKADLEEIFALFPRIKERLPQKAGLLSGGEQQMVAIARALLSRPRLIMLDEPSLGLAPKMVRSIFDSFIQLRKRGVTLLLVEQLARLALEICDRAYVLETGHITLQGSADEIKRHPGVVDAYLGSSAPSSTNPQS
jgi:branched-chain amino acid transport system ATP-binding protein